MFSAAHVAGAKISHIPIKTLVQLGDFISGSSLVRACLSHGTAARSRHWRRRTCEPQPSCPPRTIYSSAGETRSRRGCQGLPRPPTARPEARRGLGSCTAAGTDLDALAARTGRPLYASLDAVPADARRAFVFADGREFDLQRAVDTAIAILSRQPNGYFLMVESDAHTDWPEQGLRHLLEFDRVIERVTQRASADTLLLFTADHSFDLRIHDGKNGDNVLAGLDPANARATPSLRLPHVRIDDTHTGEEVLVAATGPGASRVHGYLANTDLFRIMLDAWGWK